MKRAWFAVVPALLALAPSWAPAQEKVTEGQVKIGLHKLKLEDNTLYQIEVKGKKFVPEVRLIGYFVQNTANFGTEQQTFRGMFFPPKAGDYTLYVQPSFAFQPSGDLLDYTFALKTMKLDDTPVLKKDDKLTAADPKYDNQFAFRKTPHKVYPVKLKAGQTVIIDMIAKKGDKTDPYLFLENANRQILAQDDDGGGFPNARIMFNVPTDGEYKVIASALNDNTLGEYTVMVRTVKKEK